MLTHHTQWIDENSPVPTGLQQWKSREIGTSAIINYGIKSYFFNEYSDLFSQVHFSPSVINLCCCFFFISDEFGPQTRGWELEVRLENENQAKRAKVVIDWDLTGAQEQVGSGPEMCLSLLKREIISKICVFCFKFFSG